MDGHLKPNTSCKRTTRKLFSRSFYLLFVGFGKNFILSDRFIITKKITCAETFVIYLLKSWKCEKKEYLVTYLSNNACNYDTIKIIDKKKVLLNDKFYSFPLFLFPDFKVNNKMKYSLIKTNAGCKVNDYISNCSHKIWTNSNISGLN